MIKLDKQFLKRLSIRFAALVIDHILITVIAIPMFFVLGFLYKNGIYGHDVFILLFFVMFFCMYLCKDIFGGQSFGKKMMDIQIIDINSGKRASKFKTILRNLFLVLWPIELLLILLSRDQRLGDKVAGTTIAYQKYIED